MSKPPMVYSYQVISLSSVLEESTSLSIRTAYRTLNKAQETQVHHRQLTSEYE